jgi:hypothetical protein
MAAAEGVAEGVVALQSLLHKQTQAKYIRHEGE